jgi:hypothetical protein
MTGLARQVVEVGRSLIVLPEQASVLAGEEEQE